jgi:UDP-N-acetylglucosamine acyltransferase
MKSERNIHSTAIVHPKSKLHCTVKVGPYSVIDEFVDIGEGTSIGNFVTITGHTTIGKFNKIYHHSSIGEQPQDMKYAGEITFLEIGDRNTIREFCSINTGTAQDNGKTKIGNDNWLMAYVHIAHDCQVGSNTIFANNASIAGHVDIDDFVILGGFTAIHQFCKVGAHAITMGGTLLGKDVPPYVRAVGGSSPKPNSINAEGLKRRGFSEKALKDIKKGYKILYRDGNSIEDAKVRLVELSKSSPEINLFVEFIKRSKRGLVR